MESPIVYGPEIDASLDAEGPWRTMQELASSPVRGQNRSRIYELLKDDACGLASTRRWERPLHPVTGLPFGKSRFVYAEWRFKAAFGWHPSDTPMTRELARLGRCSALEVRSAVQKGRLRAGCGPDGNILFLSEMNVIHWMQIRAAERKARRDTSQQPHAEREMSEVS